MVTLDNVISVLEVSTARDGGGRAQGVLAAARTLRDTVGRDRKEVLGDLARTWGRVPLREKRGGTWNDRSYAGVTADITRELDKVARELLSGAAECGTAPATTAVPASATAPASSQEASSSHGKRR